MDEDARRAMVIMRGQKWIMFAKAGYVHLLKACGIIDADGGGDGDPGVKNGETVVPDFEAMDNALGMLDAEDLYALCAGDTREAIMLCIREPMLGHARDWLDDWFNGAWEIPNG
jgi:hypothetical protein